ncbi:MAG: hypothetical protein HZC38_18255 [Chloroflexi bacterium]|nr:hypothetical protein [Chloroflexota bacterium]
MDRLHRSRVNPFREKTTDQDLHICMVNVILSGASPRRISGLLKKIRRASRSRQDL